MIDETVQVAFRPLKSAGQYRQYYLPLTLEGAIENLDILTDSWEEKDWVDLSFFGIVEDENSVAELEKRLRSEKAQRIRIIEIERSDVQPLPGIISQPIVEKFLEIWKEREADVEFENEKIHFEVSEFRNLYALRSGDINIEMTDQSAWMAKVKSNLFSGGIDPNLIKAILDKLASTKGSMAHNRERKQLESERDQAEKKLNILKTKRDSVLEEEERVTRLKKDSQKAEQVMRKNEQELVDIKQQLELEEKIASRK